MRTPILLTTLSVLSLAGCVHRELVQKTFDPPYPERSSAGDPILAVFVGRIPCVVTSCDMRKIELVLYGRDSEQVPTTYWLGQVGGRMGNAWLVQRGTWTGRRGVQQYPDALVYVLDSNADPSLQYLWRVNDEILLVLDQSMRPRAGNGAWGFMLSRDCTPYGPRTYLYDQRAKRFVAPPSSGSGCARPIARTRPAFKFWDRSAYLGQEPSLAIKSRLSAEPSFEPSRFVHPLEVRAGYTPHQALIPRGCSPRNCEN